MSCIGFHSKLPLPAGDSFFNPRGSVHSLAAAPGPDGGMAVSSRIVDKGAPIATPGALG
jgi:quercetin dioxygenase-like cupin family protein